MFGIYVLYVSGYICFILIRLFKIYVNVLNYMYIEIIYRYMIEKVLVEI